MDASLRYREEMEEEELCILLYQGGGENALQ